VRMPLLRRQRQPAAHVHLRVRWRFCELQPAVSLLVRMGIWLEACLISTPSERVAWQVSKGACMRSGWKHGWRRTPSTSCACRANMQLRRASSESTHRLGAPVACAAGTPQRTPLCWPWCCRCPNQLQQQQQS
jgi:hypothetical protein